MSPYVIVIADDLTGAADTGASFATQGAETLVVWAEDQWPTADVLVHSTESRHLDREMAIRKVGSVVEWLKISVPHPDRCWIYKKIDSTLRGNPGPELAALIQGLAIESALVAPAFPSQGRTTRTGQLFVEGVSLTDTIFGREVASSDVQSLLRTALPQKRFGLLPLDLVRQGGAGVAMRQVGIWVADAETEDDLTLLARAAQESETRLLCGSAGLARALAAMLVTGSDRPLPSYEAIQPVSGGQGVLVVAASRHPQTLAQIACAAAAGIRIICPEPQWFADDTHPADLSDALIEGLTQGAVVLTTAGLPELPTAGKRLVTRLAQAVSALGREQPPKAMVLTGGDAAIAVGQALEASALRLRGELLPGVPWGTLVGGAFPGLPVVTKAGGFGNEDTLLMAIRFLNSQGE